MVLSKEGGESSLAYGTSDGKSSPSPELLMWWATEEEACNKSRQVRQRENASFCSSSLCGGSPRSHWVYLSSPEYVGG